MKYYSTRDHSKYYNVLECLEMGLAPDGGLFVPSEFPKFDMNDFSSLTNFNEFSHKLLFPFFSEFFTESEFKKVVENAFNFDLPLSSLKDDSYFLELFHGPTAAFKDVGARFLASLFESLDKEVVILVATSGDTGGAVASAFNGKKNAKVVVLFPNSGVSPLQEMQLTCWDSNIFSLRVDGVFDDCQAAVKHLINAYKESEDYNITSANSISIGRLLPQATYYAYHSLMYYKKHGKTPNFIIPSGNMGNLMACVYAHKWGFPIGHIIATTNSNTVIADYFNTHDYNPKKSLKTYANAMDVGAPSNFERYSELESIDGQIFAKIKGYSVDDQEILSSIASARNELNINICPHTATAFYIYKKEYVKNAIIVSTAHPAKFQEVLTLAGTDKIDVPQSLSMLEGKDTSCTDVAYDVDKIDLEIQKFLKKN